MATQNKASTPKAAVMDKPSKPGTAIRRTTTAGLRVRKAERENPKAGPAQRGISDAGPGPQSPPRKSARKMTK